MAGINLLPPEKKEAQRRSGFRMTVILLLLVVFALCAAPYVYLASRVAVWEERVEDLENRRRELVALKVEVDDYQKEISEYEVQLDNLSGLTENFDIKPVLITLANSLPKGVWLEGLSLREGRLGLEGGAEESSLLGSYVDALTVWPGFEEIRIIRAERSNSGEDLEFELEAGLENMGEVNHVIK